MLFGILVTIQNDGTFSHNLSFNKIVSELKPGDQTLSVDLTAATDRLPVEIQTIVLKHILVYLGYTEDQGVSWSKA